jgi:uncharacterized membrane protein YraQ (UPF0718 family)
MGANIKSKHINSSCCPSNTNTSKKDLFFLTLLCIGVILYSVQLLNISFLESFFSFQVLSHSFFELINKMLFGIILGILFVGVLSKIPREYIASVLGKPGKINSIFRATFAGLFLDLCSHGILMVGMQLYKKGASLGQVMAFLIASPWNSISLTLILFTLIGFKWTLLFIVLSALIAVASGIIFDFLVKSGSLQDNPHQLEIPDDFNLWKNIKNDLSSFKFNFSNIFEIIVTGIKDSKMILKWLLFGTILSSLINAFVDQSILISYFGASLFGLGATLFVTTILEVCSEGATPIAADLFTKASAPGNSFTFLMAGVSTDYTEILSLKETTKSWKIALFLPLVTVPQILILGYILNHFG